MIYQIYPRSFCDSNDDGIGDLQGIASKLDYLVELGIDGIWLSPINKSPMDDFGYDIADYRGIDPIFGNNEDFDHLLDEAHKKGIKVILDQVYNHTSYKHPWFQESRKSKKSPKRDWYIWADPVGTGPPNNWLAAFGGRAWAWDHKTRQYYFHSFLREQPDLNWRNPEVQEAVFDTMRFWLNKGVDGFRFDVINFFIKDKKLRNNPLGFWGPYPRPYDWQQHIFDRDRPEVHDIIRGMRKILDEYDERMMVGEVVDEQRDPGLPTSYLGFGTDELHLAFNFALIYERWSAKKFMEHIRYYMALIPKEGWPCHVLSNHDFHRARSRYSFGRHTLARSKVLAMMLLTLRGTPFLYYGEEIGMCDGVVKRSEIEDPLGKWYWPIVTGRDPFRTPMQWTGEKYAGFSKVQPWLPVNSDHTVINVESQRRDPDSLFNFYKRLIKLRRDTPTLHAGEWLPRRSHHKVMSYYRVHKDQRMLVVLNFSRRGQTIKHKHNRRWEVVMSTRRSVGDKITGNVMMCRGYEATIFKEW